MGFDLPAFTQTLLRRASVTPADDGALGALGDALRALGFMVTPLAFGPEDAPTPNLFARLGEAGPHLGFAGHTDVVPPGPGWDHEPFGGEIAGGRIWGRGAADMKGGIAAFVAALADLLAARPLKGSVSLLITGDEEGSARHGTRDMLPWMAARGHIPDFCLVGEPTNPSALGEVIKIGRRGSLNAAITVRGVQGHSAYPQRADNPVHRLVDLLHELQRHRLDEGNEVFEPSCLQITSVDVGNPATNVIPAEAAARLNIRFNDLHTGAGLEAWLREVVARHASDATVEVQISGEAFRTAPGGAVTLLADAVEHVTGQRPALDTGGGTSDARFIACYCPVAEFGLVGATMHKADEHVALADLEALRAIYRDFMEAFGV
ncbi:succinyl-diaminopimelate desuccinylase [Acidomonas methanolica]|uniref:Succinyl-diaminopimelate desuccinylase n=1 Tax=Acidomonas methanolica NBRC 104435 TaxID=1231351 RepID=A0A023D0I0_ACIMT|nr:succinyl-diaminopimelate desuccinylase [Acidomonas methanolica]MBU2653901.1 succinyl-diaminopimelate desuccinylase [Acidomonas methanolica]TCS30861.1 succinyldiaminopimelate desuccinylase [Acidomonas methanolica]GAJ27574.1 succinyl-diaminopimelate desuccinylase [Acidomonas methanolica NBRC 104435]GBQ57140.1 succinyl-diaminopimelate desuccinylase [Acidomonas methanolica]GEK98342.1 succinyl-diaminopimelate desuccinylase [Acidomonas methanolica NBRC 104435]